MQATATQLVNWKTGRCALCFLNTPFAHLDCSITKPTVERKNPFLKSIDNLLEMYSGKEKFI